MLRREPGCLLAKALLEAGFTGWVRLPPAMAAPIGLGRLLTVAVGRSAFR